MLDIARFQTDAPVISLLLTEQCPLACEHCMYSCGPHRDPEYMSDEVIVEIVRGIKKLHERDIFAFLNLVGGEPTNNMKELERVLETIERAKRQFDVYLDIEMTTNGWWLGTPEDAVAFLATITPYVSSDGTGEGIRVRISNDRYHQKQLNFDMERHFEYMMDNSITPTSLRCSECEYSTEFDERDMYTECPECGEGELEPDDYEYAFEYIEPHPGDPWIYVEDPRWKSGDWVVPTGRGANVSSSRGDCSATTSLAYLPNGDISDTCCMGSKLPIGDYRDDMLVMLALAEQFREDKRPNCWTCDRDASLWMEDGYELWRQRFEADVANGNLVSESYEELWSE